MAKIDLEHNMFNYRIVQDHDLRKLLEEFPFHEVTWNESSRTTDTVYTDSAKANLILNFVHTLIASKYLSEFQTELTYARTWQGKTGDGENCEFHIDKMCEIDEFIDIPNRKISNYIALYYHSDLLKSGVTGLEFWNKLTGEKKTIRPQQGDLVLIDERDVNDHIFHRVINYDNTELERYVVGFGFIAC
jgi:hypothetical protein